ncbi:Metallo-dependent phosphatase-like protein [Triangularia verruculosa]|uniref:Metallo-dependent phosphatase-like protein n=1 Tax=Triangularia verruculosa TaxID=2587418 RepID=A0AAN6X554_9PEZI|nr:Metallo-dependent phosphatase-like protein [Triangularia verruculosa]
MPAIANLYNRQPPRRTFFIIFGTLSFLTLCIFTIHLPILNQLSALQAFEKIGGGHHKPQAAGEVLVTVTPETQGQDGRSGMTYSGLSGAPHIEPQPEPHSSSQAASDVNNHKMDPSQRPLGATASGEEDMDLTNNQRHHKHPPPPPLNLIGPLPPSPAPLRRLIIISDVHGHLLPLQKLLYSKLNFSPTAGDHAIFVGDLVTKGPDSKGVVALAMSTSASAVRGNHEDRVLAAAYGLKKLDYWPQQQEEDEVDSAGKKERDRQREREKDEHAKSVAKSLSKSQLKWLAARPVILRVGQLGNLPQLSAEQQGHHKHHKKGKKKKEGEEEEGPKQPWNTLNEVVVVHGGLVPGVELEKQDPWAVMNMRSLIYPPSYQPDKDGKEAEEEEEVPVPVDSTDDGEPWSKAWNRHQNHIPSSTTGDGEKPQKKTIVIYGHDARRGLQVDPQVDITPYAQKGGNNKNKNSKNNKNNKNNNKKAKPKKEKGVRYAFGLDSGCGHGKRLTALVINLPTTQEQQQRGDDGTGSDGEIKHEIVQVSCDDVSTGKDTE